MTELIIADICN